jgi:CubicO group peptidase (beta-lactamase class C family)
MATQLPRATPESQGVDSSAILALVTALSEPKYGTHSLMVVRHGSVIAEGWWGPYSAEREHIMFSVSKSFTATAIGIAQAEGRLSVDDTILSFFPSYATPAVIANAGHLKVRHLLAMATGHAVDTMEVMRPLQGEDWIKVFLECPIVFPPGTHFLYNSGASFVLAALLTARTGMNVLDYLTPRLFEPLGIDTPPWEVNPRGINLGASGLRLKTEDMAKLGELYLRRGLWGGRQVLEPEWVDAATALQVANGDDEGSDWAQGYGFQWWRTRNDGYRADGAHGQFSMVWPELDLVVAITAGTAVNREVPAVVWANLFPGTHADAVAESASDVADLNSALANRDLSTPMFLSKEPPAAAIWNGRVVDVSFNTFGVSAIRLSFSASQVSLDLTAAAGNSETVSGGTTGWTLGYTSLWPYEEMRGAVTATRAGWLDDETLVVIEQCIETPYRRTWSFAFSADGTAIGSLTLGLDLGFWQQRTEVLRLQPQGQAPARRNNGLSG